MNYQLINFYNNQGKDNKGREFKAILRWSDHELEHTHDYIQWLFPLQEASQFNPHAPILDDATLECFASSFDLRSNAAQAFHAMMDFYGLSHIDGVCRLDNQKFKWITPNNHNFLRLTRIIKFLVLIDMNLFARALYKTLLDITISTSERKEIMMESMGFWAEALKK